MTRHLTSLQSFLFATLVLITAALALHRATPYKNAVDEDVVRGKAAHAFESHYDERFPVKTLGINVWAAIDYTLFHEGRPGVVLGKDGWLYTDEEFNVASDSEQRIGRNLALIGWVRQQLAQKNIKLMVVTVPAKTRVYPEFLGRRRPAGLHADLYNRIQQSLHGEGIAAPDLLAPLSAGKSQRPTFLRTDTHWTPWGAELAAQAIAVRVRAAGYGGSTQTKFATHSDAPQAHKGDLFNFLPLDPYFAWLLPRADQIAVPHTESDGGGGDLLGDGGAPQVALVGTSYSANPKWNFPGYLKQALGEDVMNYAKEGMGPYAPMLAYLNSEDLRSAPPRLVIWELPERYVAMNPEIDAYAVPAEAFVSTQTAEARQ
jgi:alginate O-acetyltransferase complex protein AlgJ